MQLAEVNLPPGQQDGFWTLPSSRSKNGRAIRLPLSPLARATLEQAIGERTVESPLVFTTTGRTSISGWSRAKANIDRRVRLRRRSLGIQEDMPDWRIHDFRRAFATAACDLLSVDPAVADRCLNHTGAATTSTVARIYGRSELFEPRREALNRWAELLAGEVESARANPALSGRSQCTTEKL
jgi:integrase